MKKYAIIGTWNGEGYSSENKLHAVVEAQNYDEVMAITKELVMSEMMIGTDEPDDEFFTLENGHGWTTGPEEDSGTYQFFEILDDTFGFVVLCNVNDVQACNKDEFDSLKLEAISQADEDDYDEGELDSNNVFIGAYGGDYDYQFITI